MAEVYIGTKFRTIFASQELPRDGRVTELADWCHRLAKLGVVGDTVGNLSYRTANGFVISRTASNLATITDDEFVEVLNTDIPNRELTVAGTHEPSSEAMMHAALYQARPDVNAVFHGHSQKLLDQASWLQVPVTEQEQPYGTGELAAEILKILHWHKILVMRKHGFVVVGRTMAEAGRWVEHILARLS
jgi:L-ribulose-5-phosphate 4-epimerase